MVKIKEKLTLNHQRNLIKHTELLLPKTLVKPQNWLGKLYNGKTAQIEDRCGQESCSCRRLLGIHIIIIKTLQN